jgi:hypothetical protein
MIVAGIVGLVKLGRSSWASQVGPVKLMAGAPLPTSHRQQATGNEPLPG